MRFMSVDAICEKPEHLYVMRNSCTLNKIERKAEMSHFFRFSLRNP